jgi:hypothetical protein
MEYFKAAAWLKLVECLPSMHQTLNSNPNTALPTHTKKQNILFTEEKESQNSKSCE